MTPVKKRLVREKAIFILLPILLFGLLLRGLNSTFGSPSLYILNDEAIAHLSAFNMIAQKTPVSLANYTPLGAYIQIPFLVISFFLMKILGLVNSASDFEFFVLANEGYFLFIPRLISALFGTLTIIVIYRISRLLFEKKQVALIGAFLGAVSFNLVHISHFGRPWSASLFFSSLAIYLALKRSVFGSILFLAVSFGFHQGTILLLPLIVFLLRRTGLKNLVFPGALGLLAILGLGSLTLETGLVRAIENGQSLLRPKTIIVDFFLQKEVAFSSLIFTLKNNLAFYFLKNLLTTDGLILIFSLLAMKELVKKEPFRTLIVYLLVYFISASLFFYPLLRYLLPLFIIMIPLASYKVYELATLAGRKLPLKLAVYFSLAVISLINPTWWNWLYLQKPTFVKSREWINNNVNLTDWLAFSEKRYYTHVPSRQAIEIIQVNNPGYYQRLYKFLKTERGENARNMLFLADFEGDSYAEKFENMSGVRQITYIVDYYLDPEESLLRKLPEKFEIAASFSPLRGSERKIISEPLFDASYNFPWGDQRAQLAMFSYSSIGPYVDILKVK